MVSLFYASLLALLLLFLAVKVILARVRGGIALGDGGINLLKKRIRAHGNLIEYAPLFLIILFLLEAQDTRLWVIHMLGATFVLGRIFHAFAFLVTETYKKDKLVTSLKYRRAGVALTFVPLGTAAVMGIWQFISPLLG